MEIDQSLSSRGTALLMLAGLACAFFGFASMINHKALEKLGQVTEARVTASREMTNKGKTRHQVQYAFQPTGAAPDVTRKDVFGRSNLWSTLPEVIFKQVVTDRKIQVRFVPSSPGNNAPAAALPAASDSWVFIGLGGVLILFAFIAYVRQKKREALAVPTETPDDEAIARVMDLPVLKLRASAGTYGLVAFAAVPLFALAGFLLSKGQDQTVYALLFFGIGVYCFLNVASIRLIFDGRKVVYSSLMKRTQVMMQEVTGAKIGYPFNKSSAVFFFLSTLNKGDVMLNLRIFRRADAQELCQRFAMLGILPTVEEGAMAQKLVKELYPMGISSAVEEIDSE
jgi:hypothetical protein